MVSAVEAFAMSEGEERVVTEGPCVLTSVVMCERTSEESAAVLICGLAGEGPYYRLRLAPGGVLAFSDNVALPWGLRIMCQWGDVAISVAHR